MYQNYINNQSTVTRGESMSEKVEANNKNIKVGNIVIFKIETGHGLSEFDGNIVNVGDKSVDIVYLEGCRSRNCTIKYSEIIAKLDKRKPWINLENSIYNGQFLEFKQLSENEIVQQ